jgi:Recombinase
MATNPGATARRLAAHQHARRLGPIIAEIRAASGAPMSSQAIARALTSRGMRTPRGGPWSGTTVGRVLRRIAELDKG